MSVSDWSPSAGIEQLVSRARMLKSIRAFFSARDVLEVETPLVSSSAVTDLHIDSMRLVNGRYLNTSPEYPMKRLLAAYRRDIYQVCKCFRESEAGHWHNPEFSMLEWYRVGFTLEQLMDELAELVSELSDGRIVDRRVFSYADLFEQVTGIDPHTSDVEALAGHAHRHGIEVPEGMARTSASGSLELVERDSWLDWLMSTVVTPTLPDSGMNFIVDYPASQCALAKLGHSGDHPVARRFEMYLGAHEIANAYEELTDAGEQRERFDLELDRRALMGRPAMPIDERLLQAMQHGLPACSGVAVGLDRLLALMAGDDAIGGQLSFDWQRA